MFRVGDRVERYRIGEAADYLPDDARDMATWFRSECSKGRNPAEIRRGQRAEPSLGEVWTAFLTHHEAPGATRKSLQHDKWRYERHLAHLGWRRLGSITRPDVARLHSTITAESGAIAANRAVVLLSSLFGWWSRRGGAELANPCRGVVRNAEPARARYLLPDELRRWWRAVLSDQGADTRELASLLLLTGVRRGNLQRAKWEQIDLGARCWRIPGSEMKAAR